ncbi:MAG: tRNA glutamyl-Q(34) synthetase GluQRS [Stappiaceae bacterium]
MSTPVFRFAPSPNGYLHLGHAYSALKNYEFAQRCGGRFLLRLEDIDQARCTEAYAQAIFEDLSWLGLTWEEPVRRQSGHFEDYERALQSLRERSLVYKATLSRREVRDFAAGQPEQSSWPSDPDGAPIYPPEEVILSAEDRRQREAMDHNFAWRLKMNEALACVPDPLVWEENGSGPQGERGAVSADPAAWGDVVLARKDVPTSYHLAVTIDDAAQGVTDIVRGCDLFWSTSVHRLLQSLLKLPVPRYIHHDLVLDENGRKLSKSLKHTSVRSLRSQGVTVKDVRRMIGL